MSASGPSGPLVSLLECKKSSSRSHSKRKYGNIKRKMCTENRINNLSIALNKVSF